MLSLPYRISPSIPRMIIFCHLLNLPFCVVLRPEKQPQQSKHKLLSRHLSALANVFRPRCRQRNFMTMPPPYPSKLDELVDWASLFHSMEQERCILCIGPDILNPPTGERLEEQLASYLRSNEKALKISVYDDGWFHYQPGANELSPYLKVKAFYEQPHPWAEQLMCLIAQMPFHFVLNFAPDYKLKEAYENSGLGFVFDSYKRNKPYNPALKVPTRQQPLVFNMLGELKEKDSLVMTYKDYYEYIRSVINSKSMSDDLENNIYDAEYFIFLGMPFDKWYVHLFMHILHQHVKGRTPKFSANTFLDEKIGTLCDEQYTMTFVPQDIDIEMFVKTLHEKCRERGLLRGETAAANGQEQPKPSLPFAQLREWVLQDELDDLFDFLARQLAGTQWLAESDNLEAQHQDLRRKIRRGTLSQEQQTIEANRVRDAVFEFIGTLKKHFADQS